MKNRKRKYNIDTLLKERVLKEVDLMIKGDLTVRQIAKLTSVSKSTVHRDLKVLLPKISKLKANKINKILEKHKALATYNGGQATKAKYMKIR